MARPVIKNVLGFCVATVPPPKPVVLLVLVWPVVEDEAILFFISQKKELTRRNKRRVSVLIGACRGQRRVVTRRMRGRKREWSSCWLELLRWSLVVQSCRDTAGN